MVNIYVHEITLIFKVGFSVKVYDYCIRLMFILNFNVMDEDLI